MDNDNSSGAWHPYEGGSTLGQVGSEGGVIVADEEHRLGARISLEHRQEKSARYAIACGMYGWFFHTRFFGDEAEARGDFDAMKAELSRMLGLLAEVGRDESQSNHEVMESISSFVDRFPT